MKRRFLIALGFLFLLFIDSSPAFASINLVKAPKSSTVYYLNGEKSRHVFPNEAAYKSWYGDDFSKVVTMSDEYIASIPLGKNVTIKPGKYLVKVPSSPKVYAVEQGGVLRHIEDPAVIADIYGEKWEKKVVDLPEAFFQNYTLGESIKNSYDIPDSIVYKIKNEKKYYWKSDNIIQPFESIQTIIDNGYFLDDVIVGNKMYYERKRPILSKDDGIDNPLLEPIIRNIDCENKKLKAAFIFISNASLAPYDEINKIQAIREQYPEYFLWATRGLSGIDVSYPTAILKNDGYFINMGDKKNDINLALDEIAHTFYDSNPDVFDFLIIFGDFKVNNNEQAHFAPVTNRVEGIGMNLLEADEIYGSSGKLKGIIVMNNINDYSIDGSRGLTHLMNTLLHEMMHQWSGAVQFLNDKGILDTSLLREPDYRHWSFYAGFISPLGGGGWQNNKDGTYTSKTSQMEDSQKKPLSDLDLYLMGLLPYQVILPVYYIIPDNPLATGNTISAKAQTVTIDEIISANGKWRCNL